MPARLCAAACRPGSSLGSDGGFNIDDANDDTFGDYCDMPTGNMLLGGCTAVGDDNNNDDGYDNDDTFGDNSHEQEEAPEWEMPCAASAGYDVSEALTCLLCCCCCHCVLAVMHWCNVLFS
jgi:hypothetical protein